MWERILGIAIFATLLASVTTITTDIIQSSNAAEPEIPLRIELTTTPYGHHLHATPREGIQAAPNYGPLWNVTYHNIHLTPDGIQATIHAWDTTNPAEYPNWTPEPYYAVYVPEDYKNAGLMVDPPERSFFPLPGRGSGDQPNIFQITIGVPPPDEYNQVGITTYSSGPDSIGAVSYLHARWDGDELVVGNERYEPDHPDSFSYAVNDKGTPEQ